MPTETTSAYVCPECGKEFNTRFAFGGHMTSHGARKEREPLEQPRGAHESKVMETLRDLVDPLRTQLAEIDQRIIEVDAERADLRKARADVVSVLGRFDETIVIRGRKPKKSSRGVSPERRSREFDAKVEAMARYFEQHPDEFLDGFTANFLADNYTKEVPKGLSTKTAKAVIEELRGRGVVVADKVTRGGGMQYKLTANMNGHA